MRTVRVALEVQEPAEVASVHLEQSLAVMAVYLNHQTHTKLATLNS